MKSIEKTLARHPFMKDLSADNVNLLAENAVLMRFKEGQSLFKQGKTANYLFLIVKGKVTVGVQHRGYHLPITIVSKGGNLGWSWVFPPYRWIFEGRAQTNVEVIALEGKPTMDKMGRYPLLGYELMKKLALSLSKGLEATRKQLLKSHLENIKLRARDNPPDMSKIASELLAKTSGSILF
jgi:CRP/FNR family transcriptional regulator, cyclic AMP receptor protein